MNRNNIVACAYVTNSGIGFGSFNSALGTDIEGVFYRATTADIDNALIAATAAFKTLKTLHKNKKAIFLRAIASKIASLSSQLVDVASAESGLPIARLQGEIGRTTGQLNLFADLVEEGSWVDAIIDTALPERKPLPRADIRRMLIPIGPVVVFGASNFPLAFSVAGGDTASALAAGCPVVVKAHPAHPGTSALVGAAICEAAAETGMPPGIFSLLYDDGYTVGEALVKHPKTKAVTFTGSKKGGEALIAIARQREEPIPIFAEMGSINPVILFPEALHGQAEDLAQKLASAICLGAGQFCTNPGLMLAVASPGLDRFIGSLATAISQAAPGTMLTPGIFKNYQTLSAAAIAQPGVQVLAQAVVPGTEWHNQSQAIITTITASAFLKDPVLSEEVFGPYSLLVVADDMAQLEEVIGNLKGQLTVTVAALEPELEQYTMLLQTLTDISGRIILNGVPTGVEVCAAMQHGGPYPATNDSRFTSVGTAAIYRFVRPVAWQDWQQQLLPDELKDGNPLAIWRKVNNNFIKD
jgi:NADP-dependent aldehyde dehydrogenase